MSAVQCSDVKSEVLQITKESSATLSSLVTPVTDTDSERELATELASLGITPASDDEQAKRIHKRRSGRGELCFKCGRDFDATEPIYRDRVGGYVMFSYSYRIVSYCKSCAPPETPWSYREQAPCDVCGRDVHSPYQQTYRKHVFCSDKCNQKFWINYQRQKRHEERKISCQKNCGICDKPFTAPRSDTKYCSAACKQKAYRVRRGVPI